MTGLVGGVNGKSGADGLAAALKVVAVAAAVPSPPPVATAPRESAAALS